MILNEPLRDELAKILEKVAEEGLKHPRDLDVALDAIGEAFEAEDVMRVTEADGEAYFLKGHDEEDAKLAFGDGAVVRKGHFVEGSKE